MPHPGTHPLKLRIWLGVAISAALLWISGRNVDFGAAWQAAREMNLALLAPYLVLLVAEVMIRAWRWQILLAPIRRCSLAKLTSATMIGLMANNILPARAGEFVRAFAGARLERIPFSTCFATVVIDRVFDGLTASTLFVAVVLAYPSLPDLAKWSGYLAAAVYLATLLVLVALIAKQTATLRLVAALLRFLPRNLASTVVSWLTSFVSGLGIFRRPGLLLASLVLSALIWIGYALSLYVIALAFDIHLGLMDTFLMLIVVTIGLTLPSTPGFVGAMEAAVWFGLTFFFGIDDSTAFAVGVVFHVTQYVPMTIAGFVALWLSRIGFGEITRAEAMNPTSAA